MRSGKLNRKISIQQPVSAAKDAYGAEVVTWSTLANVWASRQQLSGREYFAAQQELSNIGIKFRIRYRDDVEPKMRVVSDSLTYDIESVIDADDRERELVLMCSRINT